MVATKKLSLFLVLSCNYALGMDTQKPFDVRKVVEQTAKLTSAIYGKDDALEFFKKEHTWHTERAFRIREQVYEDGTHQNDRAKMLAEASLSSHYRVEWERCISNHTSLKK